MIIIREGLKMTAKTAFIDHDDGIETLAANRSDQSFDVRTLPRRARCGKNLFYTYCLHLFRELLSKDTIPIA